MNKLDKFWTYIAVSLFFLFLIPFDSAAASGGKSTVGITLQQEESTSSSEQQTSASEEKTYGNTNDILPKTGEKLHMQYILLGIGIIGLLCTRRGWISYGEKL